MGYCVVWVHGIGNPPPGYSTDWVAVYDPYLNFHPPTDRYVEAYWASQIPGEPDEAAEAALRTALKTTVFARVTALMDSMGGAGAWSAFTGWLANHLPVLPNWLMKEDSYIDEFEKYLVYRDVREAVKEQVKKQLRPLAGSELTCSIIAHSWGSVVAYESLFDLVNEGSQFQCANLFTLGSPLWMVHPLLDNKTGRKPTGVGHWMNIHATGDMIGNALKPDFQVDEDYTVPSFGGDPHGSYFLPGNVRVQRDLVADTILVRPAEGPH